MKSAIAQGLKAALISFIAFAGTLSFAQNDRTTFVAGDLPEPASINRVLSAGNPGDLLLLAVAPEKMIGTAGLRFEGPDRALLDKRWRALPVIGKIAGKASTLSPEKLLALKPNLIVDTGDLLPAYIDTARRTQRQSGVPYVILDSHLAALPDTLDTLGRMLGKTALTDRQSAWARETLAMARDHKTAKPVSFYLARGADGLQTGLEGSIHTEALETAGLTNVARGEHHNLARVSLEQLMLWDPDVIFTQFPSFLQTLEKDPRWQKLRAVKTGRVYRVPTQPFGWVDTPPSINRLLGVRWVLHRLNGEDPAAFADDVMEFFALFYHSPITREQALDTLR